MALKKFIAGSFQEVPVVEMKDGEVVMDGDNSKIELKRQYVEGQYIDLHPLEERSELARWAVHDIKIKMPGKPTQQQELEWMIEFDANYVKQKRQEWKTAFDLIAPELEAAESLHRKCLDEWESHVAFCAANGLNYDIHDADKYR